MAELTGKNDERKVRIFLMEKPPTTIDHDREFPLAVYFLVISLLVMGGATALTTWFTVKEVRQELIDNSVSYATKVVTNLFHQIEEDYLTPLLQRGETYDHTDSEQVLALEKIVNRAIRDYRVRKLYFFDTAGLIVFSTQREHIGLQVPRENQHYYQAVGGAVSWTIKRRNDPLDISGNPTAEELLETYVPVKSELSQDPDRVVGVIEIYQGTEDLRTDLRKSRNRIVALALSSLGALVLVFAFFIFRADWIIRQRRRELVESNRALQDLSQNLEDQVKRRTQQLIEKEKLASLGSIAAGIAHEINTPLATIAASSEGSARRLNDLLDREDQTSKEVLDYLDLINSEAFRCKEITRSLLDYSRQSPVAERSATDINECVEQTLVLLKLDKKNRKIRFETDLETPLPTVQGDPAQVRQVIHNLTENAIYAVRRVDDPKVTLRTTSDERKVVFECEDNGPGVPRGIRDNIFEPFFTTKSTKEGIGLGLALSYSIAQRHGGVLELVQSAEEPGSRGGRSATVFRFTLFRATT